MNLFYFISFKAWHAGGMNKKWYVLFSLTQFEDETPLSSIQI